MRSLDGVSILQVITRLDKGGSAEVVLDLARMLQKDGARVGIAVGPTNNPQTDLREYRARTGVEFFEAPSLVREVSPLRDLRAFLQLRKIIHRWNPDIVHTHTSKSGILGRWAARAVGVRHIVHTPHGHVFYGYFSPMVSRAFILLEKISAPITGRLVTLTRRGMEDHLREGIGHPGQYRVIPSGADVERFSVMSAGRNRSEIRAEFGCGEARVIGWAGRMTAVKDAATFLRAAERIHTGHPDTRFLLAGDGEDRPALERLARELHLSGAVHFLGNREDLPTVMAAMDVFVLSSVNEGFGRVIVEAMAAGVPVAATAVGGVPEVVEEGVTGLLVPPGYPDRLAEAVERILGDEDLRGRLRENGIRKAEGYTSRIMVDSYEELYAELLEEK